MRKQQTRKYRKCIFSELSLWVKELELTGYEVRDLTWRTGISSILHAGRREGREHLKDLFWNGAYSPQHVREVTLSAMASKNPRKKWKLEFSIKGRFYRADSFCSAAAYDSLDHATSAIGKWLAFGDLSPEGLVWSC